MALNEKEKEEKVLKGLAFNTIEEDAFFISY